MARVEEKTEDWRNLLDRYLYDLSVSLQNSIDDIVMQLKEDFAACEYAEIDSVSNKMKKVEKVVISVRSRELETFNKFCDALENTGHQRLAIKLRGKSSSLTGEQAFSILRSNYVRLQEALPVNDILPELFSKAVVTETEFFTLQDLQNQSGEMKQRRELAKYLLTAVRRQQSNFYTLCDILLKTPGVEDLGKKLAADAEEVKKQNYSRE